MEINERQYEVMTFSVVIDCLITFLQFSVKFRSSFYFFYLSIFCPSVSGAWIPRHYIRCSEVLPPPPPFQYYVSTIVSRQYFAVVVSLLSSSGAPALGHWNEMLGGIKRNLIGPPHERTNETERNGCAVGERATWPVPEKLIKFSPIIGHHHGWLNYKG